MKCIAVMMFAALFAITPAARAATDTAAEAIFTTANEAYDRGDYAEALRHYRELTKRQPASAEAWYNAANAAFRAGDAGEAVLFYRRAWYLNPRDPDVRANMQLAQQRTGALVPSERLIDQAARELSQREWSVLFKAAYWIAMVAAALVILLPRARRFIRPVLIASVTVALMALAGWFYWRSWTNEPEIVMLDARQTALYEPREGATQFFAVPEGSILPMEDRFGQWIKVRSGDQSGWVPVSSAGQVMAWQPDDF